MESFRVTLLVKV